MSQRLQAAVLISGSGTNLQAIVDYIREHNTPCDINVVISNDPSAYGLTRAKNAGISTEVVNHRDFPTRVEFDRKLKDILLDYGTDAVFLAGFMRILTTEFVEFFHGRMLNIHPSLLPDLKGLDTHQRAIEQGREYHGASVHFVTPELDAGPVILRGKLRIGNSTSAECLQKRVHQLEHKIYPQAVVWLATGRIQLVDHTVFFDGHPLPEHGQEIFDPSV